MLFGALEGGSKAISRQPSVDAPSTQEKEKKKRSRVIYFPSSFFPFSPHFFHVRPEVRNSIEKSVSSYTRDTEVLE